MKELLDTTKAIFFLKRGELGKKLDLYKRAFAVIIDGVTLMYVGGILLYCIFAVVRYFDELSFPFLYETLPIYLIEISENAWFIFIALGFRYVIGSFIRPGLLFTSSQYRLVFLPYQIETIWFIRFVYKILIRFILFGIVGFLLGVITKVPYEVIYQIFIVLFLAETLWTIPQWLLFQMRANRKWIAIGLLGLINGLQIMFETKWIIILVLIVLAVWSILGFSRLAHRTDWMFTTKLSDHHVWNMRLISFVSGTKLTHPRVTNTQQKSKEKQRPFYSISEIYKRLWTLHFQNQMETFVQVIVVLTFMLFAFLNLPEFVFSIGLVVMIFVFCRYSQSLFISRFSTDIVQTLPWDLSAFKRVFLQRIVLYTIPFWIPIGIFFIIQANILSILQLLFVISTFFYHLFIQIGKAIHMLDYQSFNYKNYDQLGFVFIISLCFIDLYSWLIILLPILMISWIKLRKSVRDFQIIRKKTNEL